MTTYTAGKTATLTATWYTYPGGPAAAVTGVQITISPIGGGTPVIGPTSTGVVTEATGVNSYQWAIGVGQASGDYLVLWAGTDVDAEAVTATEVITVTAAPESGAYASTDDLAAYPVTVPAGASAALLLTRASRDVDRALICAVYDATAADVIAALRDATCEQVAGMIDAGDLTGTGAVAPSSGFTIGRVTVQRGAGSGQPQARKIDGLWPQAWQVLQTAGLTGQGPQERVYGLG